MSSSLENANKSPLHNNLVDIQLKTVGLISIIVYFTNWILNIHSFPQKDWSQQYSMRTYQIMMNQINIYKNEGI